MGGKIRYNAKGEECRLFVHPQSMDKMKSRIKTLTGRSNGMSHESRKTSLKQFITGWVEYFKLADMKKSLQRTDQWLRRRIRMCIWKSWKWVKTRYANLKRCGATQNTAWMWANTRKSYWHTANSPILACTLTNDKLREAGYVFLSDVYAKVHRK